MDAGRSYAAISSQEKAQNSRSDGDQNVCFLKRQRKSLSRQANRWMQVMCAVLL